MHQLTHESLNPCTKLKKTLFRTQDSRSKFRAPKTKTDSIIGWNRVDKKQMVGINRKSILLRSEVRV